jgi:hypothetical protein
MECAIQVARLATAAHDALVAYNDDDRIAGHTVALVFEA